jgi:hypothetical protein
MKFKDSDLFQVTVTENIPGDWKKARCTGIDYNDHKQVIDLMSKHLTVSIFIHTWLC